MKETNIYIKVRPYGGTYLASVYEPQMKVKVSCTSGESEAARRCAVKAAGREPLRLEDCGRSGWVTRYRAVFEIVDRNDPGQARAAKRSD